MKLGILGLQNSGKTTIFNALTGQNIETASFTSGKIEPNLGLVNVVDARITKLSEIYNIGSDLMYEKSVMDIAKILIKLIHNSSDYNKYIIYVEDRPFNDKRYYISNEKVKELKANFLKRLLT